MAPCVLAVPMIGPWLKKTVPKKLVAYKISEVADLLLRSGYTVKVAEEYVPRWLYGRYYALAATLAGHDGIPGEISPTN